jgi:hypothetical protein
MFQVSKIIYMDFIVKKAMVTLNIPEKFEFSYCFQNSKIDLENKNRKDFLIKKRGPFSP